MSQMIRRRDVYNRLFLIAYFLFLFFAVFGIRMYPVFHFRVAHGYNLDLFNSFTDLKNQHYNLDILSRYDWWLNILMFIFFPLSLRHLSNDIKLGKIILIGLITTVSIELLQYLLDLGLADLNDVFANMIGVLIGATFIKIKEVSTEVKRKRFRKF